MQRCESCDVIVYDRSLDSLREAPFEDLIIASPRRKILSGSEVKELVSRLTIENELLASDVKTKFRTQKDYINAQIAAVSGTTSDHRQKASIVFRETIQIDRHILFPKEDSTPFAPALRQSVSPESIQEEVHGFYLGSPSAVARSRIKIFVPPYDEDDFILISVDGTVTVQQVLESVISENPHLANYILRWTEDDETKPDYDLPPVEPDQIITALGADILCMCAPGKLSDDSGNSSDA